jgi:quinohemoprotein ethanol dehydrogenase
MPTGKLRHIVLGLGLISAAAIAATTTTRPRPAAAVDQHRLDNAAAEPGNWMTYGGTYAETRFSPLTEINEKTIARLKPAWVVDLDNARGQEATPLVVDGVMYTSTAWSKVMALDAATGKVLWHYDPQVIGGKAVHACCDVVNRGVAVWKGKVFVGTIDDRLIALDAKTGKLLWSVVTADQKQAYTITGAPRVFKDKVVIGNSGAELGVRGYVTAYDTATGKKVWRFYTVPGNPANGPDGEASDAAMKIALPTWAGEWWKYGGGGTVWDSMVYDPELNQLLIGVGNGSPWNHQVRSNGKGDNLFLSSIVAVDPDTGQYKWHYQETPGESWDFTGTQQITLDTLDLGDGPRKVDHPCAQERLRLRDRSHQRQTALGQALCDGELGDRLRSQDRAAQRGRGRALSQWRLHDGALGAGRACVAADVLRSAHPHRLHPRDAGAVGLRQRSQIRISSRPLEHRRCHGGRRPRFARRSGRACQGGRRDEPRYFARVGCRQGKPLWKVEHGFPWNGGTLATAGNLVFQAITPGCSPPIARPTASACGRSRRIAASAPGR